MKQLLKKCTSVAAKGLAKAGLLPRVIMLCCDGGICSQMHFYLVGRLLEERRVPVRFVTDWFQNVGTDLDGRFCRNFDLLEMFPDLPFKSEKSALLKRIYRSAFYRHNDYGDRDLDLAWLDYKAPLYLDGYFRDPEEMYGEIFDRCFRIDTDVLDDPNKRLLEGIEAAERGEGACAIHVRRGDLSQFIEAYGNPASKEYFAECKRLVSQLYPDTKFFLFSDEPDWCRENLMDALGADNVEICDLNGSDHGYYDLILMSRCRHQITSQGSMGKYAARLRSVSKRDGLVLLPDGPGSDEWARRFCNSRIVKTKTEAQI